MKKILAGVGALALALVLANPAAAAINLDDESILDWTSEQTVEATIDIEQTADITNNVTTVSSSGGNSFTFGDDVEDFDFMTGDVETGTDVGSEANNMVLDIGINVAGGMSDEDIDATDESEVTIDQTQEATFDVSASQDSDVDNNITNVTTSGDNDFDFSDDVEGGSFETGSVSTVSRVMTSLNNIHFDMLRFNVVLGE